MCALREIRTEGLIECMLTARAALSAEYLVMQDELCRRFLAIPALAR